MACESRIDDRPAKEIDRDLDFPDALVSDKGKFGTASGHLIVSPPHRCRFRVWPCKEVVACIYKLPIVSLQIIRECRSFLLCLTEYPPCLRKAWPSPGPERVHFIGDLGWTPPG